MLDWGVLGRGDGLCGALWDADGADGADGADLSGFERIFSQ